MSEEIAAPSDPQEPAAPPPEPVAQEPEPQQAAPEPVDEDAALEAETIEIPTGEKLVPLSAVTRLRAELKTVKGQAGKVADLERKLQETEGNLQAAKPYIDAARAMIEARNQQPQPQAQPAEPSAEDIAELQEIARDFDFYKADGTLDLDKAHRHQTRVAQTAAKMAEQSTMPLVHRTLSQDANTMLARAKNTHLPGAPTEKADADILDGLWQKIASQPGGLQSLANPEAAKHLWNQAYTLTKVRQAQQPKQAAPTPAPGPALFTERSGGRAPGTVALNDGDKRLARDLGMSEAEYAKEAAKMPAGWGSRS